MNKNRKIEQYLYKYATKTDYRKHGENAFNTEGI